MTLLSLKKGPISSPEKNRLLLNRIINRLLLATYLQKPFPSDCITLYLFVVDQDGAGDDVRQRVRVHQGAGGSPSRGPGTTDQVRRYNFFTFNS